MPCLYLFLALSIHICYESEKTESRSVVSHSLQLYSVRLLYPWGFARQEYWRGLPCPPPGDLPNPVIEPRSHTLQADSSPSEPPG